MGSTSSRAKLARRNIVENRLEVVEKDGVGCALENEGKSPIRVDTAIRSDLCSADSNVREEKRYGQNHAKQHDAEPPIDSNQSPQLESVRLLDDVDESPRSENPPRVPD